MSAYLAPVQDMRFVLRELATLAEVNAYPACKEATPDLVDAVLEQAGRFAADVLAPINTVGDRVGARYREGEVSMPPGFREAYRSYVEAGWGALAAPKEFGGQELPRVVSAAVQEMWKSANLGLSACILLTHGAIEALLLAGSDEQKRNYLPKMVRGQWTGTMNLTESQAGSDLSAIRARAERQADGSYRLRGQKIFITYCEHDLSENIVHLMLARTADAPAGVKGISLFLVPKLIHGNDGQPAWRNDLRCVSIEHKLGFHAAPTGVMVYGERDGALGYLVGEENRGLEYMFVMMNSARFAVGLEGLALAERAYQQARNYARGRVQGRPVEGGSAPVVIAHHPDVRRMLMLMRSQVEAMRALAYVVAASMDHSHQCEDVGERARHQAFVDLMTPVVKGWCTETGITVASLGLQVHGGLGYVEETGAAQHLRDARATAIYEGTTGIQANDLIGRKIARDRGAAMVALSARMGATQEQLLGSSDEDCRAIGARFKQALDALRRATAFIVESYHLRPRDVGAGAVPFLELMGVVAGGWQLARSALICADSPDAVDLAFAQDKIATARFFADHILTQAVGLAETVLSGGPAALRIEVARL